MATRADRRWAELHCRSNFSFLQGASHPEELVGRAADLGYSSLAITDRSTVSGLVRAHTVAKERKFKLIVGAEIAPIDAPPLVLWAPDRTAYGRLCRLITVGRRNAPKGECRIALHDVAQFADGLLAGVALPVGTADSAARAPVGESFHLLTGEAEVGLRHYREIFGDHVGLLASFHFGVDDAGKIERLHSLSRAADVPLLASQGALFHIRARKCLQDVVTAIRHKTTVTEAGELLEANAERHLHDIETLRRRFVDLPDAIENALDFADRCSFSLDELRYEYPEELAPAGLTPLEHLKRLTWQGAKERYPDGVPEKIVELLRKEFALIAELKYEAYFLTVWDLVRFARSRDILCQGRGSAANSVVCYCLGVTSVDPSRIEVLFERFVSRERAEAPDIDVDFEHERREEVLQYIYEKYGRERAGMTAVTTTYRMRSTIRDVGKALGLSLDLVDRIAKNADGYRDTEDLALRSREAGLDPETEIGRRFVYCAAELAGSPRHLSQHTGGMVMTRGRLDELCPIENAAMEGRTVIEWNKDDLDALGILKVDVLALGMLTAVRKCFESIRDSGGPSLTLASIPEGDEVTYDMICESDTMGTFQVESRAQMSSLPRLRPRCYYDLVIAISLVRPGPIVGQMVHPYLRRRAGEEPIDYPNDAIKEVLQRTLGVPLFQEQCMQLAVVAAGFTPGEADQLRRAMAAWRREGVIEKFRLKMLDGMRANGLSEEYAERIFLQIRGFGEYGFPESHAASFALVAYVSCWLKRHYPVHFTGALLNSQPLGFYAPAQLVRDLQDHGHAVLPVDVNLSRWDCTVEGDSLRLGLRMVQGLNETFGRSIESIRGTGPFASRDDFRRRTGATRPLLTKLAEADAFGSLGETRRQALWNSLAATGKQNGPALFDLGATDDEPICALPTMSEEQEVREDYRSTTLSLRAHPMSFRRAELDQIGVIPCGELANVSHGRQVAIAGLVLLKQRPGTAKGITFVTIEDESACANLILHAKTWEANRRVARSSVAWIVHGHAEKRGKVIHVIVARIEDAPGRLAELGVRSRDFH